MPATHKLRKKENDNITKQGSNARVFLVLLYKADIVEQHKGELSYLGI
jgi:hypothetical protein